MELHCPHCASPEVEPKEDGPPEELWCENCGESCERDEALLTLDAAEAHLYEFTRGNCFSLDREAAVAELRDPGGALTPISPHSDPDELGGLLKAAQTRNVIEADHEHARISIYPRSLGEPDPLLAVDPGRGPTLLGCELSLSQGEGEDPIAFTARVIDEVVEEANGLLRERFIDSAHLDRITRFLNRPGQWSGGDVCEVLAREILASGRHLREADE